MSCHVHTCSSFFFVICWTEPTNLVTSFHKRFCDIFKEKYNKNLCCEEENYFSTRQNHCHAWKGKYLFSSLYICTIKKVGNFASCTLSSSVFSNSPESWFSKQHFMGFVCTMSSFERGNSPIAQIAEYYLHFVSYLTWFLNSEIDSSSWNFIASGCW